jgi:hypothetical protein
LQLIPSKRITVTRVARTRSLVVALVALLAFTGASAARHSRHAGGHRYYCYGLRERAYHYWHAASTPRCRRTLGGAMDRGLPMGRKNGRAGRILTRRVAPGRHALVDSFGQPFGWFEQVSLNRFRIHREHGGRWATMRHAKLQVQGRGCMATRALTDSYVLVTIYSPHYSVARGRHRRYVDAGVRAFILRDLLPAGAFHHSRPPSRAGNGALIDHYRTGCGRPPPHPVEELAGMKLVKPRFGVHQLYQGVKRPCSRPMSRWCGYHYSDFAHPAFAPDVMPLMSATTGVRNGGIVRALVRTTQPFEVLDAIGYADPNVPCHQAPVARWVFGDANPNAQPGEYHIYGWFPRKVHNQRRRRC